MDTLIRINQAHDTSNVERIRLRWRVLNKLYTPKHPQSLYALLGMDAGRCMRYVRPFVQSILIEGSGR